MIRSLSEFWQESMQIPEARWLIYGTILICSVLIAVYVSVFFRRLALGKADDETAELLTGFREMRDRGHLGEAEYSKLKRVIPDKAKPEPLRNRGVTGDNSDSQEQKTYLTLAEAESRKQQQETDREVN